MKKCYKCDEALRPGEIAISAEHVDPSARWHPKCFVCNECECLLVDLLYYNRDKQIYCPEHYFNSKPNLVCAACDKVAGIDSTILLKISQKYKF